MKGRDSEAMIRFTDRRQAGQLLSERLEVYRNRADVIVAPVHLLAEEVAEEVARLLNVRYADAVEALPDGLESVVILVDDGFEFTDRVFEAGLVARDRCAAMVVAAAPVGNRVICRELEGLMDGFLCLARPAPFHGASFWYDDSLHVAATLLFGTPPLAAPPPAPRYPHPIRRLPR